MASPPVSERLCEPCKEDDKEIKARTLCYECHILLCEPCSDYHQRLKITKDHNLIELVQFGKKFTSHHDPSTSKQTSTSVNEDELASDFLEHVTLTENTVLYQGAQVALQSTSSESTKSTTSKSSKLTTSQHTDRRRQKAMSSEPSKPTTSRQADPQEEKATSSEPSKRTTSKQANPKQDKATSSLPSKGTTSRQADPKQDKATPSKPSKPTTSRQTDPRRLTATQCLQYSVKRPEDKEDVSVKGVLCVSHNVVVVDKDNKVLKLFDQSGTYLSSTALKDDTWGITCVGDSTFATCGNSNKVYLWSLRTQSIFPWRRQTTCIVSQDVYHVDDYALVIHYNGTYYCVLHRHNNTITVLTRQGGHVRKIKKKKACGKKFVFGWDIHMDSDTHNIYVPCRDEDGVLCMTVEGGALWFTPLSWLPWGITEIQGTLCVAGGGCLHMITKEGEYVRKLLDQEDLGGRPIYVCYGQDGKLYVSYHSLDDRRDVISVYRIK